MKNIPHFQKASKELDVNQFFNFKSFNMVIHNLLGFAACTHPMMMERIIT